MTRRRKDVPLLDTINPDQLYRTTLAPALFDLGWQACRNKIRSGELPRPLPLTADSKCEAWTGRQILEHRARMAEVAAERAQAEAVRAKQSQPAAFKKKIKKVKLRKVSA
jgi:hypothetical protein